MTIILLLRMRVQDKELKMIVDSKLGWTLEGSDLWWNWCIRGKDGTVMHIGKESYIRKVWSQYRECENMAGEKVLERRI